MVAIRLNITNGSIITLYPRNNYTMYADITVPANSTVNGLVDVILPLNVSAVMTMVDFQVVGCICYLLSNTGSLTIQRCRRSYPLEYWF